MSSGQGQDTYKISHTGRVAQTLSIESEKSMLRVSVKCYSSVLKSISISVFPDLKYLADEGHWKFRLWAYATGQEWRQVPPRDINP